MERTLASCVGPARAAIPAEQEPVAYLGDRQITLGCDREWLVLTEARLLGPRGAPVESAQHRRGATLLARQRQPVTWRREPDGGGPLEPTQRHPGVSAVR